MDTSIRKLTLSFPKAIEATITDTLDSLTPLLLEYILVPAQERGANTGLTSNSEKVLGSVKVTLAIIVLPDDHIIGVLDNIRAVSNRTKIAYWVEPVVAFARLS